MTNAVIVSTARTPLAKSWKGAFNMTHGATLGGHAVKHAIQRAGIATRGGACLLPKEQVAERAISEQNAWLIDSMLSEVITRGTGRRALALGRNDLAGKTGTTNDAKDTWFNGFTRDLVATVWVGYDQERSLGEGLPTIPGMLADVDVLTGKKSVLSYLVKPVLRARDSALTER